MGFLKNLFGNKDAKIQDFLSRGAILIDVRTKNEYNNFALPGSKNIPVQVITTKIAEIKAQNKPVIVYCASGMRSASSLAPLKAAGIEVMNGGSIQRVMKFV